MTKGACNSGTLARISCTGLVGGIVITKNIL